MRRVLHCVVLAIALGLALGGCSGGGSSSDQPSAADSSPAGGSSTAAAANSGGSVDCSALTNEDLSSYLLYTQVLAQVRDQASVDAVRSKVISDYTPEKMATILAKLQVLAGHPAAGFGDPADSLAYYGKANEILGRILATSGGVPPSLLAEYTSAVGDTGSAIGKQLPINAALSAYCPTVS